jgi:hypothetical protein
MKIRPPWLPMIGCALLAGLLVATVFFGTCAAVDGDCRIAWNPPAAKIVRGTP